MAKELGKLNRGRRQKALPEMDHIHKRFMIIKSKLHVFNLIVGSGSFHPHVAFYYIVLRQPSTQKANGRGEENGDISTTCNEQ